MLLGNLFPKNKESTPAKPTKDLPDKPRKDIPTYEEHHRELVRSAVNNKRKCSNCKSEGCHLKCTKCKVVAYCNRACQIADWPKHRVICREFDHVIRAVMGMDEKTREYYIGNVHQMLYVALIAANVDAEITYTYTTFKRTLIDSLKPLSVVLAEGRIYDVSAHVPNELYPPSVRREYGPLPPDSVIAANPAFAQYMDRIKMQYAFDNPEQPCMCSAFEKNEGDLKKYRKVECRKMMGMHYIECEGDREAVIRMYGAEKIKKLGGESVEEFRALLDGIIKSSKSEEEALSKLGRECQKWWLKENEIDVESQRKKYAWLEQLGLMDFSWLNDDMLVQMLGQKRK